MCNSGSIISGEQLAPKQVSHIDWRESSDCWGEKDSARLDADSLTQLP